jgi:hypothetical protein
MSDARRKAVAEHRKRLKSSGLVRIELRAPEQDMALLREIAAALADPERGARTRQVLHEHFDPYAGLGLKELLAAAPSDLELDFDRRADVDREIEF